MPVIAEYHASFLAAIRWVLLQSIRETVTVAGTPTLLVADLTPSQRVTGHRDCGSTCRGSQVQAMTQARPGPRRRPPTSGTPGRNPHGPAAAGRRDPAARRAAGRGTLATVPLLTQITSTASQPEFDLNLKCLALQVSFKLRCGETFDVIEPAQIRPAETGSNYRQFFEFKHNYV